MPLTIKLILAVSLLFSFSLSHAQKNYLFSSEIKTIWPNGNIREEYTLMGDTTALGDTICLGEIGLYRRWHSNRQIAEQTWFTSNKPSYRIGKRKIWHENGQIRAIGQYLKYDTIFVFDEKEKAKYMEYQVFLDYESFYNNGLKKYKFHWNKKLTRAIEFHYWENGKVKIKGYRKPPSRIDRDGFQKTGNWIYFNEKGKRQKIIRYDTKGKIAKTKVFDD